jgi:hypothetical protein
LEEQVQLAPVIDMSVNPEGAVSVTVTVPLVGPAEAALETMTVYAAPFCPCVKLPVCDFAMARIGAEAAMMLMESHADADNCT